MEKNSTSVTKIILSIIGAVVVLGTIVAAVIHFWDDIKNLLPSKKDEDEFEDFEDLTE